MKLWSLDIHHGIENSTNEPFSECLLTYNSHKKNSIVDVYFVGAGGSAGLGDIVTSCDGQIHARTCIYVKKNICHAYIY